MPIPSQLVAALPALVPFVGPEALERRMGVRFVLRLGANESLFGPSPVAVEAMRRAAAQAQNYGDPEGFELRTALAEHHGVRLEEVVLGGGIDELLALFCRAYGDPGSAVVTTLGSYPTLEYGALGAGLTIHRAPYGNDQVDLTQLGEKAREVGARIVYLANPDNPSGAWHSASDIAAFRQSLPTDTLLLLDEAYADFAPSEAIGPFATDDPGVVRLRTFSKAHGMAGMRVGYAVGHAETVGMLNRIRMHFGMSLVSQVGALASLGDPEHVRRVVQATSEGRGRMAAMAEKIGLAALPSATNFVLLDAGTKERADRLLAALLERGAFVRKPAHPPLDRCVRITIGREEDLDRLEPLLAAAWDAARA